MVQKIKNDEYLKRFDNMTAGERSAYTERVGEWLRSGGQLLQDKASDFESRLQNVITRSLIWNDQECRAFEEGARLLSAMIGRTDTWLPDILYNISAKRAVRRMNVILASVLVSEAKAGRMEDNAAQKPKEVAAEGTVTATQPVGGKAAETYSVKTGDAASVAPDVKPTTVTTAVPSRPEHIDQYVHLLPQSTQDKAAKVKDMLRELDEARRKMDLLAEDPTAKADDRAAWAKKTTSIDSSLRKIYNELDAEWAKLVKSGRVVVDDLGNARVVEGQASQEPEEPEEKGLTPEQKARRRELRKWLVDTRRGNGDTREEHVRKWMENFREFLTLEGDAAYQDAKVMEAARHYGIFLDADIAGEKK